MMKNRLYGSVRALIVLMLAVLIGGVSACAQENTRLDGQPGLSHEYRFSGPYTHKNLTIYLVHGSNQITGKKFLTLQEAMDRKLVKVYETGNVNELAVQNLSRDSEVFIHAGDIVRGGQQDRTLSYDLILPAKSGRVKIASFCVEQGRWRKRGGESSTEFNSSTKMLAGRDMKLAAKHKKEQGAVWNSVSKTQDKLTERLGSEVRAAESESSMELALDNGKVRSTSAEYVKALADIIKGKEDVIGYVFAINGKVNSGDVYGSAGLFRKLWPKLLNSSVVEAIAEEETGKTYTAPAEEVVRASIDDASKGAAKQNDVNNRVRVVVQETKDNVLFETRDRDQKDAWVHRNYIKLE